METKNYISMLKSPKRAPLYVAMQQALCYFLYQNGVQTHMIVDVMNKSKSNVYYSITQAKDRLEIGDAILKQAYEELDQHQIRVVPCIIEGDVLSRHVGYKLTIDNVIY